MDHNTEEVAGALLGKKLENAGISYSQYVYNEAILSPDEQALGRLMMHFDRTCDLIIGVGSGTINDLSRYFSYQLGLPYYIVATAPSMDGYASTVAPLIKDRLKTTFAAHVPQAIIGDLDILAQAPKEMLTAGFGDVVGKFTCLADWKLSALINGEYYCERVAELTKRSLERTIELREGIARGDREAIGELTKALILSGIAMTYVGNSRPASGAEHHIAHFWEMRFLWENRPPILHGTKVGIATVLVLKLYHLLSSEELLSQDIRMIEAPLDPSWSTEIERVFLESAPAIIRLEEREQKNNPRQQQKRLAAISQHWTEIQAVLKSVPTPEEFVELLEAVHAPTKPADVGIGPELVYDALLHAKELRPRYTILQLLWDLALLKGYAQKLVSETTWSKR